MKATSYKTIAIITIVAVAEYTIGILFIMAIGLLAGFIGGGSENCCWR